MALTPSPALSGPWVGLGGLGQIGPMGQPHHLVLALWAERQRRCRLRRLEQVVGRTEGMG